ncbi:MAG: OmpA family protein [Nitrospirae bacterium]|nr:OmpA family protein [Nitrospirota bacterium]
MKKQSALIIKKVRKGDHGGHHGGSWKVAYADFVTAMMAFFLLLWLITMVSPEKRARVSSYFKNFSIYTSGGSSFMEKSSELFSESGESSQKALTEFNTDNVSNIKEMEKELKEGIMGKLEESKDQVLVDTVEGGVRIQMTDKDGSLMFERGSNMLSHKAREILHVIGQNINNLPNKITIEGHTDALPYARSDYSNWELSTERASSARRELEFNGLDPQRIERVSGYADNDPLIKDNPTDPRNRRISIILKVPYTGDFKPAVKHNKEAAVKKDVNDAALESERNLIIKKFDENLSSMKEETRRAVDKKAVNNAVPEKTVTSSSVKKNEAPAPSRKDEAPAPQEVIKKPVIIKELINPVISKDDLFRK